MAGSKTRSGRRKVRPDTPMPATRHCTNCGNRHGIPTGKRCAVKAAARSITPDDLPSNRLIAPLCEDEIQADLGNRASSSPVQVNSDSNRNGLISGNTNNPSTGPGSLNFLADTMVILHKNMQSMQSELQVIHQERHVHHSDSWQQLQGIHDSSRINNVNNVLLSDSSGDGSSGDLNIINHKRSVKSGRDRTGADDSRRVYVKWPQEACFIGPERRRVKYDDLTHPQWVLGLITIASEEVNPRIQSNMFKYLASLQQDVCDFGFQPSKGAHSLILSYIEEGKASWDDLPMIQALRESCTLRSQSVKASTNSVQPGQTQPKNKAGTERTRICRNYNTGECTREASHVSNAILYNHFCTFCSQSGARNAHTEMDCKKKLSIKPVNRTDLS